jgi:hypothetical protein
MEYRRGRPSDERRRRVMLDDSRLANGTPEGEEDAAEETRLKTARKSRSYPDDALATRQMRLTDLLPVRVWAILAIAALVVVAAAGIHLAYLRREALTEQFGAAAGIFDVKAPGSLGRGLSVLLLAGATLSSFLIYSLRRHKMDDYRGHYGIWLLVTGVLFLLTVSDYTGVTGLAEAIIQRNAPVALLSRLPLVLHSVFAFGVLLFLARMGAEMQHCRSALAVLALLLATVGAAVALKAGWRPNGLDVPDELLSFHALLASRGLLFAMLLVYGRYTRLDALGNIKVREKKPRKKAAVPDKVEKSEKVEKPVKAAVTETKPSAPVKVANTPVEPAAPVEKPVVKPQEKFASAPVKPAIITAPKPVLTLGQKPSDDDEEENGGNGRLSRSERRRLKQLGRAA